MFQSTFSLESGELLFTYPDVTFLSEGNAMVMQDTDYLITKKQLNLGTGTIEYTLQKI